MDLNTLLSGVPILTGLVSIVYFTYVSKPFIDRLAESDKLTGDDFTRLFTALLAIGVSFAFPASSILMTVLQGATLAAVADGSYKKILTRFKDEAEGQPVVDTAALAAALTPLLKPPVVEPPAA